jgi:hypothetical protein
MILDEWQREALAYKGDLLLCTGRRVGKTYVLARKAVDLMASKRNCPIIMISLTEDQAMIIMAMALHYAREKYPAMIGKGKKKPLLRSLWVNNNQMIIRPVGHTGDGARGFEGGVLIVDEASRMPKIFWLAARPIILTTNGKIWMGSTPHGKQGYFWEMFEDAVIKKNPKARFKVFYKSTPEVINERALSSSWTKEQRAGALRILKEDQESMSEMEYGQEYLGLFLDELRQYFSDESIDKACVLKRGGRRIGRDYYMGVDIARMGEDEIAFEIIDKAAGDNLIHVENITARKKLTTWTEEKILELNRHYDEIVKIFIDAGSGSLGVGIYDHLLRQEETKRKVVAINNRARALDREGKEKIKLLKEDLYDNLRSLMERGHIKLLDDDNIRHSLKSIQYEYVQKDKGKTQMRIFGSYAHIVEGLIRAAWCSKEKELNIWVRSIKA